MGKMLETLKRAERQDQPHELAAPTVRPEPSTVECPEPAPEEDIPFIEVGGPNKMVDASPAVLKADSARPGVLRAAVLKPALAPAVPRATTLLVRDPMTVALRPRLEDERIPAARVAPELIAYHHPEHPVSEQYRTLLGQLLPAPAGDKGRTLLFASLAAGAGTTTAVLNLAVSACARFNLQTIVVDANLCRPAVAQRLGLPLSAGLHEVLAGTVALEPTIQKTAQDRLCALTAGTSAGPSAALPTEAIRWVVAWLRERFDLICIDGPLCTESELGVLVPTADAIYLVLDQSEVVQPKARLATRTISQFGGRVAGYIITQG